jgi:O-acetyl-ADP-ribose deacetylase (regulator of RNase III)
MIIEKDCNLLLEPLDAIGHFCNAHHMMGGGIALRIKEKYPEAYEADLKTIRGDKEKMGTFSYAVLPNNKHIINCYTQFGFGVGRQTNYEAVCSSLEKVHDFLIANGLRTFGLPKRAGCVLGGGDYRIVRAIIECVFSDSPLDLYICNYNG